MYGGVPPDVVLVNVTDCPALMALDAGRIDIVGSALTVITEFDEYATEPTLSVTDSSTLNVPPFANVMVLPVIVTPDSELTV